MEKLKQKAKKEKSGKNADKDKSSLFISDVKSLKENLKIREILRTVKMNSSMRLKAPRGSKVMQNKDFNDNDEFFEETTSNDNQEPFDSPSVLNPVMVLQNTLVDANKPIHFNDAPSDDNVHNNNKSNDEEETDNRVDMSASVNDSFLHKNQIQKSNSLADCLNMDPESAVVTTDIPQTPIAKPHLQQRHRKLSLDQTMLSRSESLSQSNVDLHLVGKSPLERKSSFFRKKMDSFLKNTTEIFKRQSSQSKTQCTNRRGSMSMSLQSLNGKASYNGNITEELLDKHGEVQGSVTSLQSSLTAERSASSLSVSQSDRLAQDAQFENDSIGSSPALVASQPLADVSSNSVNSLNEALIQEAMLNRAISMSSGLDSAQGKGRRKASRSNRLTWVASEGITNYFRRLSQGEKNREIQGCHSYQDFSTIPENNLCGSKVDSKGRRLSYQRAVSGEDPLPPSRYHDSSLRRKPLIPENSEADYELVQLLAEYARNGIPPLRGLIVAPISDKAFAYLYWAERSENLVECYDRKKADLDKTQELRQSAIRELITTEVDYIRHLVAIVEIFLATAHALQDSGKILEINTEKLFINIPDVLNANLYFWEQTIVPMLVDAVEKQKPLTTDFMVDGFWHFGEIFTPYEKYVSNQNKALEYLKSLSDNVDFAEYLSWCHSNKSCNRLLLSDFLAKPMQRLTKYSLLLRRIINHTELEPDRTLLITMEGYAKTYVTDLNRTIRKREELAIIDHLSKIIDNFEIEFKDEELDKCFRAKCNLNLKESMPNCLPGHSRTLIFQGDLRYKDYGKEQQDVRAFILTDMLLICKKLSKGPFQYKMLRPKYMIDRMVPFPKNRSRTDTNTTALVFVSVDEVGSSVNAFALSDPGKDGNGVPTTLKIWDAKLREAKMTYRLSVYCAQNPTKDFSDVDVPLDLAMITKQPHEDPAVEREVRERVATMLHRTTRISPGGTASGVTDPSHAAETSTPLGSRAPTLQQLRLLQRTSTDSSSRSSRLSTFEQSLSSQDDIQAGPSRIKSRGQSPDIISTTTHILNINPDDDDVSSITVNIFSETESETQTTVKSSIGSEMPHVSSKSRLSPTPHRSSSAQRTPSLQRSPTPQPPVVILEQSSPQTIPPARSLSTSTTLRVGPQSGMMAFVHSLPDLSLDTTPSTLHASQSPIALSASEKLYKSHQELLERNRLATQKQYLSPERGISYPPTSSARASLKRGLAFSHSFKNPPLYKMRNVHTQSQHLSDLGSSTTPTKTKDSQAEPQSSKGEKKTFLGAARSKDKSKSKEKEKSLEKEMDKAIKANDENKEKEDQKKTHIESDIEPKSVSESVHDNDDSKNKEQTINEKPEKKLESEDGKKAKDKGKGKGKRTNKSKDRDEEKAISQIKDECQEKVVEDVKYDRQDIRQEQDKLKDSDQGNSTSSSLRDPVSAERTA